MTRAEIDILWQRAMAQSVKDGEMFTRYHFAKLIADAERERIKTSRPPRVSVALERARQEEREACAKLCDDEKPANPWKPVSSHLEGQFEMAGHLAERIRARGQA